MSGRSHASRSEEEFLEGGSFGTEETTTNSVGQRQRCPLITRGKFGLLSSDDEETSPVKAKRAPSGVDSSGYFADLQRGSPTPLERLRLMTRMSQATTKVTLAGSDCAAPQGVSVQGPRPQFHENPQREKQSAKLWLPTLRAPTLRAPTFSVFGPPTLWGIFLLGPILQTPPFSAHPSGPTTPGPRHVM